MEELVFRIEAILRRVKGKKGKEITMYKIGKFTFDTQKQVLLIGDIDNFDGGVVLKVLAQLGDIYVHRAGVEVVIVNPDGLERVVAFICILDVMMPKKDGLTLAQEIRTVNSEIPIIFLTAKSLKDDILEGFKIGADDYITKPFSMEEIIFRPRLQEL